MKMVLGKRWGSGLELGSGVVRYTRSMSGKRVAISSNMEIEFPAEMEKPIKDKVNNDPKSFQLEALPEDILVRILCGVDHEDLKQLFHVSKLVREATIVAKKLHFEFSTPTKKTFPIRKFTNIGPSDDDADEIEVPNAPKQSRIHNFCLGEKNLANISVALFASSDEEVWPKKNLFPEMEN